MPDADRHHATALRRLAQLLGVQTTYSDSFGQQRSASPETLSALVEAMGQTAETPTQIEAATQRLIDEEAQRVIEPVTPVWAGSRASVNLNLGALDSARAKLDCLLTLEDGSEQRWTVGADELKTHKQNLLSGLKATLARLDLPRELPLGYHMLRVRTGEHDVEAMIICAPERSFCHEKPGDTKPWGIFSPTYALRRSDQAQDMGCGDLADLAEMAKWSASLGARVVATLPMLAQHLDEPFDPSPYAPVSRLCWNEMFIDVRAAPELERSSEALELLDSPEYQEELSKLRLNPLLVDYRAAAVLKKRVLEILAREFWQEAKAAERAIAELSERSPMVRDYSIYRSISLKQRAGWTRWPDRLKRCGVQPYDYDPEVMRYHLYVQHLMEQQLNELRDQIHDRSGLMYLDLPVGVSTGGFDVWKNQELFALSCATGAPPDPYFTSGQNWGFAPLRPRELRETHYRHLIDVLRHHMRHADMLRLDHVMAFHRLFWIPRGAQPTAGAYVRYQGDEIYAILCLESHRNKCQLVGENLGTVPAEVNESLTRHNLAGLFVAQYEMHPGTARALREIPAGAVASLNTHDMAPFAKHWAGGDVDDRISLNMLAADLRESELEHRMQTRAAVTKLLQAEGLLSQDSSGDDPVEIRDALLRYLARSEAAFLLINIEDLWMETDWQNVPGTVDVHPNWQRRLRLDLDQIKSDPAIKRLLEWVNGVRGGNDEPTPVGTMPSGLTESAGEHHAAV